MHIWFSNPNFASETKINRHEMIKYKGTFEVHEEGAQLQEPYDFLDSLPVGEYQILVYDMKKNRSLPQLKYLFGVVLRLISQELPSKPPINILYRYFETIYAPLRSYTIEGRNYEYRDLKNEKAIEVDNVIQRIIHHAKTKWGIEIPDRDLLKTPEAVELYTEANEELWRRLANQ